MELHATGLNDLFLLDAASRFNGSVMLGVGGSTIDEIEYAINYLRTKGKEDLVLMYGFQSYPTNYSDINLSKMIMLKDLFNLPVGYADHTAHDDPNNETISVMAAALGFNILEKHFALCPGEERIDYHAGVGKSKMKSIRNLMEIALQVHGNGQIEMSIPEKNYGNTGPMKKAIVARRRIKKGEAISLDNVWFKRTVEETPVRQMDIRKLLGRKASQDIMEDEIIDFSKIRYEFRKQDAKTFTHVKGKRRR
jgi:sialic acid synthase SpsE